MYKYSWLNKEQSEFDLIWLDKFNLKKQTKTPAQQGGEGLSRKRQSEDNNIKPSGVFPLWSLRRRGGVNVSLKDNFFKYFLFRVDGPKL